MSDELLFSEAVLGFRCWTAADTPEGPRLQAFTTRHLWAPGINRATCLARSSPNETSRASRHKSPHSECSCGLYAYHALRQDLMTAAPGRGILGAIAAFGDMKVYRHGFRAEHALRHRSLQMLLSPVVGEGVVVVVVDLDVARSLIARPVVSLTVEANAREAHRPGLIFKRDQQ